MSVSITEVDPNGHITACTLDYGTTPALGSTGDTITVTGFGKRPVVHNLNSLGLTANMPYYIRVRMISDTQGIERNQTLVLFFNPPSAASTIYHVKTQAAGGDDANNGLSAGAAKRTIQGRAELSHHPGIRS
jgi:hypothetical protein